MKKGFTLIELIAILTILGILATIVTPIVVKSIRNSREKAYNSEVNSLIISSEKWALENTHLLPNTDRAMICVSLEELKQEGFIKNEDIINPMTEGIMNGSIDIIYESRYNNYAYEYKELPCSGSK